MDSDLAESLQALKAVFEKRKLPSQFGKADAATVEALRKSFRSPRDIERSSSRPIPSRSRRSPLSKR